MRPMRILSHGERTACPATAFSLLFVRQRAAVQGFFYAVTFLLYTFVVATKDEGNTFTHRFAYAFVSSFVLFFRLVSLLFTSSSVCVRSHSSRAKSIES